MKIEETIKLGELLDLYGELLSNKQRQVLNNYINNDMSLAEIAENENVSRVAVLDAIKKAKQKLFDFETKIKLYKIKTQLNCLLNLNEKDIKGEITKILEDL